MIPFLVCRFEKSTLSNLVKECFGENFPDIFRKRQIDYIYGYLKYLTAKTVLLEFEYIDKDYIDDYSKFYVKRFNNLGSRCARLHFFSKEIDHTEIDDLLATASEKELSSFFQKDYLGFMVIKPLPKTFIGRTCLVSYPGFSSGEENRQFLARDYQVNLFGTILTVRTLAFQEQDKVVSACATTAIWGGLNALSWKSVRDIPSCSEITTAAINFIENSNNGFPSKELSNKQILRALDVYGVRHHLEMVNNFTPRKFFETVKIHIDSQLPMLLGATVYDISKKESPKKLGGHAVTIVGYKREKETYVIYVHDDRLGPYARAEIHEDSLYNAEGFSWRLQIQGKNDSGEWSRPHEFLIPETLISITNKKVQVPYIVAFETSHAIKKTYEGLHKIIRGSNKDVDISLNIIFDLRLLEISAIKREIVGGRNGEPRDEGVKQKEAVFLASSFARFQWVSRFYLNGELCFYVLMDSTEIPQGDAVSAVLPVSQYAESVLKALEINGPKIYGNGSEFGFQVTFMESFLRKLTKKDGTSAEYWTEKYGALRAPKYLKPKEYGEGTIFKNSTSTKIYDYWDESLEELVQRIKDPDSPCPIIWAVNHEGALLLAQELPDIGHPALTGFKPARIAGELHFESGAWIINSKSGRYSGDYNNSSDLMKNVLTRFKKAFSLADEKISIKTVQP